ncbi:hypothetical protein LSH36_72g05013 [Paralvinella palmiformis]|uniref:sphingomyelin phosphodiesterase n=1 Tax=Paralvinella palmiformis TaxID=53620 RepID=A0AAD9NBH2_9ANNE|nr:hypothetical protein LSH36_72g05013 [Paralvinella palmiformis]
MALNFMQTLKMKVLTLNCWGVPVPVIGGKLRKERINAIGKELANGEYDVVLLQEIWTQHDYNTLCAKVLTIMPYTHYFHRQLHADYMKCHGDYNGHRIAQAFELSQVVKNTSDGCDVVILGGDFNYCPDEVGCKIIMYNGNLKDAWLSQKRKVEDDTEGTTCDRHDNSFTMATCQDNKSPGSRLDYLMYRNNADYTMDCEDCHVTMQKVPGESYNYSDHLGVMAEFVIRRNITAAAKIRETGEIEKNLTEALPIIDKGLQKIKSNQVFFVVSMFFCLVALVFTSDIASSWTMWGVIIGIFRTFLTVAIAFLVWNVLILSKIEWAGLTAAKKDINNLLKSNPA